MLGKAGQSVAVLDITRPLGTVLAAVLARTASFTLWWPFLFFTALSCLTVEVVFIDTIRILAVL